MNFNVRDEVIALTPQWKGERLPDGRPKVDEKYLKAFNDLWNYTEENFADKENGEWYGYLRRDGNPTLPACIGSTFKGPFHVPRCLIMLDKMLEEIEERG